MVHRVTTSDNESRVVQRMTTNGTKSDDEWQRVINRVTKNDNERQRVTKNDYER